MTSAVEPSYDPIRRCVVVQLTAAPPHSVTFSPEAYAQLRELARRYGRTLAKTIQEALSLDWWWQQQLDAGYSIQVRRGDGATRTVARP